MNYFEIGFSKKKKKKKNFEGPWFYAFTFIWLCENED